MAFRGVRAAKVSSRFRVSIQGKDAETEPAAEGRSGADIVAKQGVHGIPNAIAQVVAEVPHMVQPGD